MCRALYALMTLIRISDQKTSSMDKLYYFFLQTNRIIPIWLEYAEDQSKRLLTDVLKNILADTKDAESDVFVEGGEDENSDANN